MGSIRKDEEWLARDRTNERAAEVDYGFYESSLYHDKLEQVNSQANGRVLQLIGFGFGDTRDEALAHSRQQLDEYPGYHMFLGRGGELEVIDEGEVRS